MNVRIARCLCGVIALGLSAGCATFRTPVQEHGELGAPVELEKTSLGHDRSAEVGTGLLVPNASGKTMHIPGKPRPELNLGTEEAAELKLKTRELAAQLFETRDNQALLGLVAMPTSFVNLSDFDESSPLGRYLAEAMFYEFNQRNFPVREYRLRGNILLHEDTGEIALSRKLTAVSTSQSWAALLIGTYQRDKEAVFINARLVRPADGMVLRTAHLMLPLNGLMDRMTTNPPKPPFASGSSRITAK